MLFGWIYLNELTFRQKDIKFEASLGYIDMVSISSLSIHIYYYYYILNYK